MISMEFFREVARGNSALRALQNSVLAHLELRGSLLDLGSGHGWSPPYRIREGRVFLANFDVSRKPAVCFDLGETFPFLSESFDAVTMLCVMEHLPRPDMGLREIRRVIRRGGKLVVAVPFVYRVHRSPDDFYRFTDSSLRVLLAGAGFSNVVIIANGTGSFLASYSLADVLRAPGWLRACAVAVAVSLDLLYAGLLRIVKRPNYRAAEYYPLGYIAVAEAWRDG